MCLVPPADRLQVLDADDLADQPGVEKGLQPHGEIGVEQDVTDGEEVSALLGAGDNPLAILQRVGHGLFHEHGVALRRQGEHRRQCMRSCVAMITASARRGAVAKLSQEQKTLLVGMSWAFARASR